VEGKIDRIDLEEDGSFSVMDYKTGREAPSRGDIEEGVEFQVPLYLLAAQRLFFPHLRPREGYYLKLEPVRRSGRVAAEGAPSAAKSLSWETLLPKVEESLKAYSSSIRAGEFPVSPRSCSPACPYRPICRKADPTPAQGGSQ
jgi:ATP-dependent helicase/DNAse subunit B